MLGVRRHKNNFLSLNNLVFRKKRFSDSSDKIPESGSPPDLGDNLASNDYKEDTSIPELDFSGGSTSGESSGGLGGLFGGGFSSDDLSDSLKSNFEKGKSEEKGEGEEDGFSTPKVVFFSLNLETYRQLDSDLDLILKNLLDEYEKNEIEFKNKDEFLNYIYNRLEDYNWTFDTLSKLSFGDRKNLDEFIFKKIKNLKNISKKFDIFSNLSKIYSSNNNNFLEGNLSMSGVKTKLAIKDGKIVRETIPVSGEGNMDKKELISSLVEKVSTKIVEARRAIKRVKLSINAARGLLAQREKFAKEEEEKLKDEMESEDIPEDMELEDVEDEGSEGEGDVAEEATDLSIEDILDNDSEVDFSDEIKEIDNELAEQSESVGESADELQSVIKELTEAVRELNKAVQSLSANDITKDEDDQISELISEGKEVAEEGMDALDEVSDLESEIKTSMRKYILLKYARKKKNNKKGKNKKFYMEKTKSEKSDSDTGADS
ncbi:MAG: hypothetical protein ABIK31_07435, partial [candidate division WOR-3 bacterium]